MARWNLLFKGNWERALAAFLCCAFLLLLSVSTLYMYASVFSQNGIPRDAGAWNMKGWGGTLLRASSPVLLALFFCGCLLLCGMYMFLSCRRGKRGYGVCAVLLPSAAAGIFLTAYRMYAVQLRNGFALLGNEIIFKINEYYQIQNPFFSVGKLTGQEPAEALVFLALLLFWWQAAAVLYFKRAWLSLLPAASVLGMCLAVGYMPCGPSLVCFALGGIGVLPFGNRGYRERDGRNLAWMKGKSALLLAVGFLFCIGTVQIFFGDRLIVALERQKELLAFQRGIEDRLLEWEIWDTLRNQILPVEQNGSVSNYAPRYEQKEVMTLHVSALPTETVYLRGYAGDTYENGIWKSMEETAFLENADGLTGEQWRELSGAVSNMPYEYLVRDPQNIPTDYLIDYTDEEKGYAFFPYYTDIDSVRGQSGSSGTVLPEGDSWLRRDGEGRLEVHGRLPGQLPFDTEYMKTVSDEALEIAGQYQEYLPRYLTVPDSLSGLKNLGKELREELDTVYGSFFGEPGGERDGLLREQAAVHLVREALFSRAQYSLELAPVPSGRDVTEYFLFDSGQGFCQHYASAGALLLREMGVPARYVTGYVVLPDSFSLEQGGYYTARVPDSAAHAWVEIYIPAVGWIPAEMTEGQASPWNTMDFYASREQGVLLLTNGAAGAAELSKAYLDDVNRMKAPDKVSENVNAAWEEYREQGMPEGRKQETGEADSQSTEKPDQIQNTGTEDNHHVSEEAEPPGGNRNAGNPAGRGKDTIRNGTGRAPLVWFLFLLIAAGGIAVWKGTGKSRRSVPKDRRRAVRYAAERLYRLLRRKRIVPSGNIGERSYRELLRQKLTGVEREELERYFSITERAAFGNGEITEEEAEFCEAFYRKIKRME